MKTNFYEIFRKKLIEQEGDEEISTKVENESTIEKVLRKSKKIPEVLTKLLTTEQSYNEEAKNQIREVVSDLRCIAYKPTTFRVVIPNGNYFDLKYDPTPLEVEYPEDYNVSDSFTVLVSGKKYNIVNKSELEQCLDYIGILLKTKPVTKEPEPEEAPGAPETPEATETPEEELPKEEEPEAEK